MKRPKLTLQEAQAIVARYPIDSPVQLLGIRGYSKRTMGHPLKNDRGIYDDALFILAPELFAAYNANTDPSVYKKSIANLKTGVWWYKPGKHKFNSPEGYPALVQADKVTVLRDGAGTHTGWYGINIHKGGYYTTSSLGCQTIYPAQWDSFITSVYDQLARNQLNKVPYILTEF